MQATHSIVPPKAPKAQRVLMTADTVGGVWSYTMELVAALEPWETQFLLMTMGPPLSGSQREQAERLENLSLVETNYRLEWMDDPWREVDAASDQLMGLQAQFAPDLVHLNGFSHGSLPWEAPVLIVAHSCVLSWWQSVFGEPAPKRYEEYKRRVSRGLTGASRVIAPTQSMLAFLCDLYGFTSPGQVVFNGRNPAGFNPGAKSPFIMAAGRLWDQAKNFALLDQVAPRLPWPVFIAGNPSHPDGSQRLFPNLNYLGTLTPSLMAQYLGSASIFVSPALYEPFGLAILEAALCGCALVLADIPSLRELWEGSALFADPRTPAEVEKTLWCLIEDERLRRDMGEQALVRAQSYSSQAMAAAYSALYQELAPPSKRTPWGIAEIDRPSRVSTNWGNKKG